MNNSFYSSSIRDLVDQGSETVVGHLAKQNPFALDALQRNAWLSQIELVRTQLGALEGWIAFEFTIPRMGKRADVVLITAGIVFVLGFKVGSQHVDAAATDQVVDYAQGIVSDRSDAKPGPGTAVASRSGERLGAHWSRCVVRRLVPQARRDQCPP